VELGLKTVADVTVFMCWTPLRNLILSVVHVTTLQETLYLSHLFTYNYLMEQIPSWEAGSRSTSHTTHLHGTRSY